MHVGTQLPAVWTLDNKLLPITDMPTDSRDFHVDMNIFVGNRLVLDPHADMYAVASATLCSAEPELSVDILRLLTVNVIIVKAQRTGRIDCVELLVHERRPSATRPSDLLPPTNHFMSAGDTVNVKLEGR